MKIILLIKKCRKRSEPVEEDWKIEGVEDQQIEASDRSTTTMMMCRRSDLSTVAGDEPPMHRISSLPHSSLFLKMD